MWAVMCVCCHVCHTQAQSCLSTGWALNRCFAWGFGTAAVLAQGGGGVSCTLDLRTGGRNNNGETGSPCSQKAVRYAYAAMFGSSSSLAEAW